MYRCDCEERRKLKCWGLNRKTTENKQQGNETIANNRLSQRRERNQEKITELKKYKVVIKLGDKWNTKKRGRKRI